jgi:hypothetical protein
METRGRSVKAALVEMVLIVAGVLIAFQADEWNDDRKAEAGAQAQLGALVADFQANQARLDTIMQLQDRVVAAQVALLNVVHGHNERPGADSLEVLISWSYQFFRLEPITGAYDALVSSGDVGRVNDSKLRADLAVFFGHIAKPYEDAALADLARHSLFEAIGATTDLLAVTRPSFRGEFPRSSQSPDFDRLFASNAFRTQLASVAFVERNQRGEFRRIYTQSEEILSRLERYLAGAS